MALPGASIPAGVTGELETPAVATASDPQDLPAQLPQGRTLVMCFDGTMMGGENGKKISNVDQFCGFLVKNDSSRQMVYYASGIGTTHGDGRKSPWYFRYTDALTGYELPNQVRRAYQWLVDNYSKGSKLCFFGFSRGAYVARCLAGMLSKVGLLPRGSDSEMVKTAYNRYKRCTEQGWTESAAFRDITGIKVQIDFLGIWDTVASIGLGLEYLPFTLANPDARVVRHAVALDERRVKFSPYLYARDVPGQQRQGDRLETRYYQLYRTNHGAVAPQQAPPTDLLEVWFAGGHSDIGGNYTARDYEQRQDSRPYLARIALHWMIRQCYLCETGILFDQDMLEVRQFPSQFLKPAVAACPFGVEEPEEQEPVTLASIYHEELSRARTARLSDRLAGLTPWWLLEALPWKRQAYAGAANILRVPNMGRARRVLTRNTEEERLRVHFTVAVRMGHEAAQYQPLLLNGTSQFIPVAWTNDAVADGVINSFLTPNHVPEQA